MPGTHCHLTSRRSRAIGIGGALLTLLSAFLPAATLTWIGENGTWSDNGSTLFWSPADEPDADDTARFNTAVAISLGTANEVAGLTMSGNSLLNLGEKILTVTGTTLLSGATIELPPDSRLFTGNLTVTRGKVQMSGGTAILEIEKTPNGLLSIASGATLRGFGNIGLADTPLTPATLVTNDGTLLAVSPLPPPTFPPSPFNQPPAPGTLQITSASSNARIDLDGSSETGNVVVDTNQTLDLNLPLADDFNGSLALGNDSVFDSSAPWTTAAGSSILVSNVTFGIFGDFGGTSYIRGGLFTQSGGTLTVDKRSALEIESAFTMSGGTINVDESGSIVMNAPFSTTGGTISTAGPLIFESDVTTAAATTITLAPIGVSSPSLKFAANTTSTINGKIINDGNITSQGVLNLRNPTNDYSGVAGNGSLTANGGTINLLANGAAPLNIDGSFRALDGGLITVGAPSDVNFLQGSNLSLADGILRSPAIVRIAGRLSVQAGDSVLEQSTSSQTLLTPTMTGTITGNILFTAGLSIQQGAAPTGNGSFQIPAGKSLTVATTDLVNVHVRNGGNLSSNARLKSYDQTATGSFTPSLNSTAPGQFTQLIINGDVQLAGTIRPILGVNYVPKIGDTFDIITANSVTGSVNFVQPDGLASTLAFSLVKTSASIRLIVIPIPPYQIWARSFFTTSSNFNESLGSPGADPDRDGLNNYAEFALDGHPNSSTNTGKVIGKIATIAGQPTLTYTFPVRTGSTSDPADPAGGEFVLRNTASQVRYHVQATSDLANFNLEVQEITGPEALALQQPLPTPTSGWAYRTFRVPAPISANPRSFLRVAITE